MGLFVKSVTHEKESSLVIRRRGFFFLFDYVSISIRNDELTRLISVALRLLFAPFLTNMMDEFIFSSSSVVIESC